jgi:hypothetical protein
MGHKVEERPAEELPAGTTTPRGAGSGAARQISD